MLGEIIHVQHCRVKNSHCGLFKSPAGLGALYLTTLWGPLRCECALKKNKIKKIKTGTESRARQKCEPFTFARSPNGRRIGRAHYVYLALIRLHLERLKVFLCFNDPVGLKVCTCLCMNLRLIVRTNGWLFSYTKTNLSARVCMYVCFSYSETL